MTSNANFTSIDLNSTGTTELANPNYGVITGAYLKNGGSSAEVELQVADGSNTATLAVPGAGNNLEFSGEVHLASEDKLQIDVTTAEGSSQTNTAVVFKK